MLAVATDYISGTGPTRSYVEQIAAAGFSHVHWGQHQFTDFVYFAGEIDEIARWLDANGLRLLDLHATPGIEKGWMSPLDYERAAGIELVKNRIAMTERLGGDAIVLHLRPEPQDEADNRLFWLRLRSSLDALESYAKTRRVKIALENLESGNFPTIKKVLAEYDADFLALCYDSGHGNMTGDGLDFLDDLRDRLTVLHLNDNEGTSDQHLPLFAGTVEWERLAAIIARSSYTKCISMEILIRESGLTDERAFLAHVFTTGTRFAQMVERARAI